jgi:Tfp pilus assembly protein PilF
MNRLVFSAIPLFLAMTLLLACTGTTQSGTRPNSKSGSNPLYSLTLQQQGSVLLQQGRYQDALERFEEADQHGPGNATVFNMIGICHLKLEEYEAALASFDQALLFIPSFTDARNNRGATYLALGQYRMAEVDFVAVLADKTYPHRWEVHYNLGMSHLQRSQLGSAEDNFRRAVTAPAPVFDAFLRLAEIYHKQGKTESAIEVLREARFKFPDRFEASLSLARILLNGGRVKDARSFLDEVISADPESDLAQEARELIKSN